MSKYKAIDFRLRPPYKSFSHTAFYDGAIEAAKAGKKNVPEAVLQRSMELLIKEMDESNIEIGVAVARESSWGGQAKNSDLPGLLKEYPGRFIGVPHIQFDPEKNLIDTVKEYVTEGPCSAIYMEPGFRFEKYQIHADDERLFYLYEYLEENNIPLLLQYGGGVNTVEYYNPSDVYHIADRFPNLKVAITHGGWPQVMAFIQQAYAHKNVYISPDIYFSGYPGSQDYITAANTILSDKILFGSAYPLASLADCRAKYDNVGVREEVLPKILYDNAAAFFGLDEK